jgi:Pilus biogenesis CpaD protein (pilus_cpaD)
MRLIQEHPGWSWPWRAVTVAGFCALLAGCDGEIAAPALFEGEPGGCIGCATERNIAAVLDRPADLAAPRREGPRDALRREADLSAYRGNSVQYQNTMPKSGNAQP